MSLIDAIAGHAARTPDRCALHFEGEDISYSALWQRVEIATLDLRQQGVKSGERVAWLGLNDPYLIVLLLALCRIGAILLPLNYRLALPELQGILDHAQTRLLLTDSAHRSMALELSVVEAAEGRPSPDASAASAAPALAVAPAASAEPPLTAPALGADPPALLVYTSGTTGNPKGALHTQAGLMANCVASQHAHGFMPQDHVLTALPLFHVGGLCIQTLPALVAGARVTLLARFDAGEWLRHIETVKPTMSLLVPAAMQAVIQHPTFASTDVSSLQLLNADSSTIPLSLIGAFHARGVPVCQVYGATETGPVSIYLQRSEALQHAGSAGRAGVGVEVRLVNDAGLDAKEGEVGQVGEVGEIWLRAPNVMQGYWRDPGNPSFQNGWFHSGDLARRDLEGFYWIVGRSKDMIISGGENIYPAEIENILADCPHIAEAAVLGMPDERWGEMAVAVVVRTADSAIDEAQVMQLFDGKLARFKHPRQVLFVNALPKSALGKVIKSQLKSTILKNSEK